jgi:hypothetical protein
LIEPFHKYRKIYNEITISLIIFFNMLGEQISSQENEVDAGDNLIKLNTRGLVTGAYFLRVKKEECEYFEKNVVSK